MGKHQKVASFPCRGKINLRIYSWYSLPGLKHDEKRFIRIPSLRTFALNEGPVKLIKWVKIAHSFLQYVSDQFHIIILSFLPM